MNTDFQVTVAGSAGDGTIAVGELLRQAMALAGYKVFGFDIYPAEVRGFGKCVSRSRITSEQTYALRPSSDVFLSLDDTHALAHVGEVRDGGVVCYESDPASELPEDGHLTAHLRPGQMPYGIALRRVCEASTGTMRSRNIVALGYLAGLFGLPVDPFLRALSSKFKKKKEVVEATHKAFHAGVAEGARALRLDDVVIGEPHAAVPPDQVLMNGNAAVVRGCVDAGIDTFFGYPITPATPIMERLAVEMPKYGGRLVQTEDEIAAIAATIGAGFAGSRSATSTSGPGLSLMAEMLGLGVMAEVPCVVFVSQRGGPSTGMPTKTEQSDLALAVFGGHGDAPRIVLAPTSVDGCYRCGSKAFEMAERYQVPVIVLLDLYLSNRYETVVLGGRQPFEKRSDVRPAPDEQKGYRRFVLSADGVSPRAVPGDDGFMHVVTGLEHNELGRPNDQADIHTSMSRKRHDKLNAALKHADFTVCQRYGDEGPVDVGILAWGSTFGECLEAMRRAREEGIRCAAMKVVMLAPFPAKEVEAFMDDAAEVLVPEVNYEGQFARLVQGELGRPVKKFTRVDGVPMKVAEILDEIRRIARRAARWQPPSRSFDSAGGAP